MYGVALSYGTSCAVVFAAAYIPYNIALQPAAACCNKIAEAEAAVPVNEKKWLASSTLVVSSLHVMVLFAQWL
jgi:hypothetical protein